MSPVDLNCDMGESYGAYTLGMDEAVIRHITSANIACGYHAGDANVMQRTVKMAAEYGVAVGAHPAFPDLLGFGRRNMACTPEEITHYVIYQIGALQAFCKANGVKLQHVKPHGSLYNMAVDDERIARAIAQGVARVDPALFLVTLAGKQTEQMLRIGREEGVRIALEAFPDRAYTPEGTLASRKLPGAVITDPDQVAGRAVRMATEGVVTAIDGTPLTMHVHTLCVHGDNPSAVDLVRKIRERLALAQVEVTPFGSFLAAG
jgi:5-oxoprolinase (ATP-hydrolysing) subunit A